MTVRLFARPRGPDNLRGRLRMAFSGATINWSYPDHLHEHALTRAAVTRHAISVCILTPETDNAVVTRTDSAGPTRQDVTFCDSPAPGSRAPLRRSARDL
jgi:hypothetical protein